VRLCFSGVQSYLTYGLRRLVAIELVVTHHVTKVRWKHVVLLCVNSEDQKHLDVVVGEESRVKFIIVDIDENFL